MFYAGGGEWIPDSAVLSVRGECYQRDRDTRRRRRWRVRTSSQRLGEWAKEKERSSTRRRCQEWRHRTGAATLPPPPSFVGLKSNGVILVLAKRCRPKPCEEGGSLAAVFTHARPPPAQAPRRQVLTLGIFLVLRWAGVASASPCAPYVSSLPHLRITFLLLVSLLLYILFT